VQGEMIMNRNNTLITQTDSYKVSHWLQFPPSMKGSYYYIEARGGADKVLFFGLQAVLKKILNQLPIREEIYKAEVFWNTHGLPFNTQGWLDLFELGYYPLEIKAVKEGKLIKTKEVQVTIESTDERFAWLPGWLETRLLQLWYPTTVCTKSFEMKKVIMKYLKKTGTPDDILFKLHDFGYRGVSSEESAEIGAMAHLVNFMGTDTVAGIFAAQEYYNANMAGFSIPAAEHSTITSWGKENENLAYKNMLDQFAGPEKIVAVVSDSYNIYEAIKNIWGKELKQQVIDSGATIVIRPDSGDPMFMVKSCLELLDEAFGHTVNAKGYKVLNNVRVIQGDGISGPDDVESILQYSTNFGYSADNVAFGMGGGILQQVNRDTYKYAMKMSAINIESEWHDVFKQPVDCLWKVSKKGRFDYLNLDTVWKNGNFEKEYTFDEVRDNALRSLIDEEYNN
jgi:nicotinamide phosphoribosyltransferase